MKHIKGYKTFESVITPSVINNDIDNHKNTIRLYRIENKNIPYDESREGIVSKKEIIGGFFTDNIDTLSNYIRKNQSQDGIKLVYIDIHKNDLDKYHVSRNEYSKTMDVESDNWIIPSHINRNYIDLSSITKVTGNFTTLSKAKQELKSIIDNLPMKYIKGYKTFESVITPSVINNDIEIKTFEDLVEFGRLNDFDVVDYEEFYDSLPEGDKKTAPPKVGTPFFALFHPIRKKPMFVLCIKNMARIPDTKTVSDIIGHERIHGEQNIRRGGLEFSLPNPSISKDYFSNKEEIMAFAWSIANELSREGKSLEESMIMLDKERGTSTWIRLWSEIKRSCDDKIIKRYRKYIYLYLEEMI